jgi:hypothetical protein
MDIQGSVIAGVAMVAEAMAIDAMEEYREVVSLVAGQSQPRAASGETGRANKSRTHVSPTPDLQ